MTRRGTARPSAVLAVSLALAIPAGASLAANGDAARGEKLYDRCIGCHSIERDRTGPRHAGIVGRKIGSVPDFPYSAVMRDAGKRGLVWDEETLDRFLENPMKFMPGTRMTWAGMKNAQERADLIAYLRKEGAQHATAR